MKAWTLPCRALDKIVLDRLIALAEYDNNLVERVKQYFAEVSQNGASRLEVLDTAIQETQVALRKLSRTIVALTKKAAETDGDNETNEETAQLDPDDPIMVEHRKLRASLRNLQKQRDEAAIDAKEDPGKSIADFYHVLSHLRTQFNLKPPQIKKDIIKKLVEEVKVNAISPHLYTLHITWIRPLAAKRDDVALLWRSDPTRDELLKTWTWEEEAHLQTLYPDRPQRELLQAMPYKTPGQIKKRAWELSIKRDYWHIQDSERFYWTVCFADLQAVAQFASTPKQEAYLYREINRMAEETKRGNLTDVWFLPIDMVSFTRALCVTNGNESGLSRTSV